MNAIILSVLVFLDGQFLEITKPYWTMEDCLAKAVELVESNHTREVGCEYQQIDGRVYRVTFGQET